LVLKSSLVCVDVCESKNRPGWTLLSLRISSFWKDRQPFFTLPWKRISVFYLLCLVSWLFVGGLNFFCWLCKSTTWGTGSKLRPGRIAILDHIFLHCSKTLLYRAENASKIHTLFVFYFILLLVGIWK
jgi:hypothetical protein